jgi:hypothetical protein
MPQLKLKSSAKFWYLWLDEQTKIGENITLLQSPKKNGWIGPSIEVKLSKEHDKISEDWSGIKFIGLTIDWDYCGC